MREKESGKSGKTLREKETDPQVLRKRMLETELNKDFKMPRDLTPSYIPTSAEDGLIYAYNIMQEEEFAEAYKIIVKALQLNPEGETHGMLLYN